MKNIKSTVLFFILLFVTWVALTGVSSQELSVGLLVSLLISILSAKFTNLFDGILLTPSLIWSIPLYVVAFSIELVKSNVDIALRVINPKLPIDPAIVKIKTNLKSDIGKLILANSITLTPGTLTVDVVDDFLYIHCVDAEGDYENVAKASERIAGRFESILKGIVQ